MGVCILGVCTMHQCVYAYNIVCVQSKQDHVLLLCVCVYLHVCICLCVWHKYCYRALYSLVYHTRRNLIKTCYLINVLLEHKCKVYKVCMCGCYKDKHTMLK